MNSNERNLFQHSPSGRVAIGARLCVETVVKKINEHRRPEDRIEEPHVPSISDFAEFLDVYVRRELLTSDLALLQKYGSFADALKLQKSLDDVNFAIAKIESR